MRVETSSGGDVMLHFELKLSTGAQFHVFMGTQNCEFEARQIKDLPGM